MQVRSVQADKGPFTGSTAINASTGTPLTAIGEVSGAGTTFTKTTVTDAAVWDLSSIVAGMVAKTSGGWVGLITVVDDANNKLTVEHWESRMVVGDKRSAAVPAAGETVQVHRVHKAGRLTVLNASVTCYLARSPTPTAANSVKVLAATVNQDHDLTFDPKLRQAFDLTEWYVISAAGNGTIWWVAC